MKYDSCLIDYFINNVSKEFGLDHAKIQATWANTLEEHPPQQTDYIAFMKEQRALLKKEQPDLKFGQISKMIGERWREHKKSKKPKGNAYLEFAKKERPIVRQQFPLMKFGEISKEVAKRWKALHLPPPPPVPIIEPIPHVQCVLDEPIDINEPAKKKDVSELGEFVKSLPEYTMTFKDGETCSVPLVCTPWYVMKAIKENFNEDDIFWGGEVTPIPSPPPRQAVVDGEDRIPSHVWERWNDFCRNYYLMFFKGKPIEEIEYWCGAYAVPKGPRMQMIINIVENEWWHSHYYYKKKRGYYLDDDVYKWRLTLPASKHTERSYMNPKEWKQYLQDSYQYLYWPDRRIARDNTPYWNCKKTSHPV